MVNSRGITTSILTLGFTALTLTACETQTERERVTEAIPSPTVGVTPAPGVAASPVATPVAALSPSERTFMADAARGGMMEVQLSNLAEQKASSNDVKRFAEHIATSHSQLGQKLQQLASSLNVTLPQTLEPQQQNLVSRLEKLSSKAFDREYLKTMISDHLKDISEFERAATETTNADIKQFVSEALPTLRDHLKTARELATKLGIKVE